MERPEPTEPDASPGDAPADAHDALRKLEARLDRASEAAERLLAEATARAGAAARAGATAASEPDQRRAGEDPPPAGWQSPDDGGRAGGDLELLVGLVESVRDLIPTELQQRLAQALRELLLALRALIDWYLERAERRRGEPAEVQDIPIQ